MSTRSATTLLREAPSPLSLRHDAPLYAPPAAATAAAGARGSGTTGTVRCVSPLFAESQNRVSGVAPLAQSETRAETSPRVAAQREASASGATPDEPEDRSRGERPSRGTGFELATSAVSRTAAVEKKKAPHEASLDPTPPQDDATPALEPVSREKARGRPAGRTTRISRLQH